jgi:hypothetical protein
MNQYNRISLVIAAALVVAAALLMIDGQVLGEMTIDLGRVLLITTIPVIATRRKSKTEALSQREQL